MPLSASFPPTGRIMVLQFYKLYWESFNLIVSIVAPGNVLTAVDLLRSLTLTSFKREQPIRRLRFKESVAVSQFSTEFFMGLMLCW